MKSLGALVILTAFVHAAEPEKPIAIANRTCLFLDDHFVESSTGLKRVWHQGQPNDQVAIQATEPWEKWPHLFGSVFRDPKDGPFKMYYESCIYPSLKPPDSFTCLICYAESKDGKTWTRPKLGMHEFKESKENNIVIPHAELANVFVDPREKDRAARLKMFVYLQNHNPFKVAGEVLLSSGDGLKWKLVSGFNKPAYADPKQGDYTDSHHFGWDSLKGEYMGYIRTFAKSHVAEKKDCRRRAIGVSWCKELNKNWTPTVQVLAPDERDDAKVKPLGKDPVKEDWAEHYVMNIFPYGNHYLGLLSLLYLIDGRDSNGGGDLQLTFSHDGRTWHRQPERATLIAPSNAKGLFPTYTSTNAPLEIGDELWLYYSEANGAHPVAPFEKAVSQIRAAVWRRDGFASLRAQERGSLTSKQFVCEGNQLILNIKTSEGGAVRAAILDDKGNEHPGFALADCDPLRGDRIHHKVSWRGRDAIAKLKGKTVRLQLELSKAELYSFRLNAN